MSGRAQAAWLPGGRRLHLHHGPIDMIVEVSGQGRQAAYERAHARFETLLDELVAELPRLRAPAGPRPRGETARRMAGAVAPFAPAFITPMAAVAGAGADTILAAILTGPGIERAYVNNGGDVAFHIAPGEEMRAAIASDPPGRVRIGHEDPVRGVASSGRGGRSHSLGIADTVTALAETAAAADAAATMIANAVDLPGHPASRREPASVRAPDSDLGERLVTTGLGPLAAGEIAAALDRGAAYASGLRDRGLVAGAALMLRGELRLVGQVPLAAPAEPTPAGVCREQGVSGRGGRTTRLP